MYIEYSIKNRYGNDLMYPENSWADLICAIAGTKTITDSLLRLLENNDIDCQRVMGE